MKNQLAATDPAIRANRARHLRIVDPRMHRARFVRHRLKASAIFPFANLSDEWPFRKQTYHKSSLDFVACSVTAGHLECHRTAGEASKKQYGLNIRTDHFRRCGRAL